jgi:para-aminobenzoate synthetase component 1
LEELEDMSEIVVSVRRIDLPHGPRDTMAALRGDAPGVLLESALPMEGQGQWSYVAGAARATLYTDAGGTVLRRAGQADAGFDGPFEALAAMASPRSVRVAVDEPLPEGLGFIGGWVGVLGYDAARHLHRLPETAQDAPVLPQMWWMAADQVLAYHHPSEQWWECTASGPVDAWPWTTLDRPAAWADTLARARRPLPIRRSWKAGPRQERMSRARFEAGVEHIREAIADGEVLQVNLTRREDASFEGDAWSLYEDLVAAHPVPFTAFIETPAFSIASCSPERFLRVQGRTVQARPIKGTVARGRTPEEDAANRDWLAASEKNRAENLMIVDLMRNDIGRVAELGSVRVPELFALEPYASVWQMVSTVQATLRDGLGPADLLRACWPPGSMTGAPKLAAMQAIEALEPLRRGFYAGSIGYIDCRGNMDLSVVIRTAVAAQGQVMVQMGGGIVADSDPASEWNETVAKGERLVRVLDAGFSGSASPAVPR